MASTNKPEFVKGGYWLANNSSSFPASNINTDLFTHLFCGFADLDPVTKKVTISSSQQLQISTFCATIKQNAPYVNTLLSIGGDGAKPKTFALMANQSSRRKAFIYSSINLARQYGFDGLDLQWLYPSNKLEMKNLGTLLNEWHDAIVTECQQHGKPQLLLVMTVFYSPKLQSSNNCLYPIDAMKSSLDWINVMSYDFYTPDSSTTETGPSAAFFNLNTRSLSGNYGIHRWIDKQFPIDSIVIGLPFYGWAWLLLDAKKNTPFSPADGPATDISGDGNVGYGKIKELIDKFKATKVFDKKEVFNYAYYDTNWISYDDENTISAKIVRAKNLNLLGYYVWTIGDDDEYSTLATTASQQWDA